MIVERYIALEVARSFLAVLGVLLAILFGYSASRVLARAVDGLMPLDLVPASILFEALVAMDVVLPIASMLAVTIGLGRLHGDRETIALAACGLGPAALLRPVLGIATAVAVTVGGVSLWARPVAYDHVYRLERDTESQWDLAGRVAQGFVSDPRRGRTVFAESVDRGRGHVGGLFVKSEHGDRVRLLTADRGELSAPGRTGPAALTLRDLHLALIDRHGRDDTVLEADKLTMQLPSPKVSALGYKRKAMTSSALWSSPRAKDAAELQWRMTRPIATLSLVLLAVPLSRATAGSSPTWRVAPAILACGVYFNFVGVFRAWVEKRAIAAWPGLWWVEAMLLLVVIALLAAGRRHPAPGRRRPTSRC